MRGTKENVMRRLPMFATLGMLGFAVATYAAQGPSSEAWLSGRLERFDPTAKTLTVKEGTQEMVFSLQPGAQLMLGSKAVQPGSLTADIGHQVRVRYTTKGANHMADRIEIGGTTAASAAATPAKK
jgi:hypothetical protein